MHEDLRPARVVRIGCGILLALEVACGCQAAESVVRSAAELLQKSGVVGGLVVHIGGEDPARWGQWTVALGSQFPCVVHGLYTDAGGIEAARAAIRAAGCYGRVSAEPLLGSKLPYADGLVNLVIVNRPVAVVEQAPRGSCLPDATARLQGLQIPKQELLRVLAPNGVAMVWRGGQWERLPRPRPDTIDDWSHALYDATNNAVSGDRVVGPPKSLQWVGGPLNTRHHEHLASVSVVVSAGGRLFYIVDEGPVASLFLPPQWTLVARDAFNGVVLWKRPIPRWEDHFRPFRSGPPQISRTLVATTDRVYVTLGLRAAVSALEPATGRTLREYPQTVGTEEILFEDGVLYLVVRSPEKAKAVREGPRRVMAVAASSGETLWQIDQTDVLPMSLAARGGRVVYMTKSAVACCDARTGQPRWRAPREVPAQRPDWSAPTVVLHGDVVLVADRWPTFKDSIDPVTNKPVARWLAEQGWAGELTAYAADSGKPLWKTACAETYHAPPDVFVIDGLVWVGQSRSRTGPDFVAARDLRTGEIKRRLDTSKAWQTTMPHHRCHRNRATVRYLVTGRTGVEFIDVATGEAFRHHWTRGTCQFGTLPANGLLYVPPHSCACYIDGKLTGFLAMAPAPWPSEPTVGAADASRRLERGPAWGSAAEKAKGAVGGLFAPSPDPRSLASDWPTYRHDPQRSGFAPQTVPADLGRLWRQPLGAGPTPPVVANGKVFVATVDTHSIHALDANTGHRIWSFTAGGRIDSPPSVVGDHVIFGSADGFVYCLRSRDGALVWRFQAAPEPRRIVAFGQVESTWPVPGNVLTLDDDAYCVAGRSSFLDGGLVLYRLDVRSGEVLAQRTIYTRDLQTGEQPTEPQRFEMPGALPDVLSSDGTRIYLRHLAFDRQTLEPRQPEEHLFSPAGFLNGDWWHRTYWIMGRHFYSGYIGWYFAGRETPAGRLLVFDSERIYGYGYRPEFYRGATRREYHLFAIERKAQKPQPPADYSRASRDYPPRGPGSFRVPIAWSSSVPVLGRAMALTHDTLLVAGPPEQALEDAAAFAGARDVRLLVVRTSDGKTLKEYHLAAPPVFDGMAVAGGRVYLSTLDGHVHCFAPKDQATRPLQEANKL